MIRGNVINCRAARCLSQQGFAWVRTPQQRYAMPGYHHLQTGRPPSIAKYDACESHARIHVDIQGMYDGHK